MAIKVLAFPFRVSNIFRGDNLRANHGADVINISIGDTITRAGSKNYPRDAHLAVQYALVKGVSAVVIGAGNDGFDFDHGGNLTGVFCDVPGVICVVATGPTASGRSLLGPFQNIDSAAIYTNFGTSAIDVAAP